MNYTQEKLFVSSSFLIVTKDARVIANTRPFSVPELSLTYGKAIANAKELVQRWNAFEEDGIATKMLAAIERYIRQIETSIPIKQYQHTVMYNIFKDILAENERNSG